MIKNAPATTIEDCKKYNADHNNCNCQDRFYRGGSYQIQSDIKIQGVKQKNKKACKHMVFMVNLHHEILIAKFNARNAFRAANKAAEEAKAAMQVVFDLESLV